MAHEATAEPKAGGAIDHPVHGPSGRRTTGAPADALTLEVIREGLITVVREMRANMARSAYSPVISESRDYSCVLMDATGQIVAQADDNPAHVFPMMWSVRLVLEKFAGNIAPGDIFIHNIPYEGSSHLNDVVLIYPVFLEGEILLMPLVRAHWADIGGMTPGSLSGEATEIYQEGILIPALKIFERGRLNEPLLEFLLANVRIPAERRGDFDAMVGTCKVGERRVRALVERFGLETLRSNIGTMMEIAEARMRRAITEIPDGPYEYETYLDYGAEGDDPLPVHVTLVVKGDEIEVDLSEAVPQVRSPINAGPAAAPSGAFSSIKATLDARFPINGGAVRPIKVTTRPGTVFNALPPAPCGGMGEIRRCLEAAIMGALGTIMPSNVAGDTKGSSNHVYIGGVHPATGESFVFYEYPAGGTGGFDGHDGNNTVRTFTEGDFSVVLPIEALESQYPLRVELFQLREGSAGAGRFRGGLGLRRDLRILTPDAQLSILSDHNRIPPWGVHQGLSGAPNRFTLVREGREFHPSRHPGKVSGFRLQEGDVLIMRSAGGGGFGPPGERDRALVLRDVECGYISPREARAVYGVTPGPAGAEGEPLAGHVSTPPRVLARIERLDGPEVSRGRRRCQVTTDVAERLGLRDDDLVELVPEIGPPVRVWAELLEAGTGICRVGPAALRMLRIEAGASLEVRRVRTGGATDG